MPKMEMVLSGLDWDALHAIAGPGNESGASPVRRAPDDLLATLADISAARTVGQVYWFYRSPAIEMLEADAKGEGPERLRRWADRHRAALNLRRNLAMGLILVNADRVPAGWLAGGAATDLLPEARDDGLVQVAEYLLASAAPEVWEVFEALESASAFPGDGVGRRLAQIPDASHVLSLLDRLGSGAIARDAQRLQETQKANDEALAREYRMVLDQLHETQEAFEQSVTSSGLDLRDARASHETALRAAEQRHAEALQQQEDMLFMQLHTVQEELEQYYLRGLQQDAEFRRLQEECDSLRDEREALRLQLSYMQEELASRLATHQARSEPIPILRRINLRIRRGLRRDNHAQAEDERKAAIIALRASPWFDQDWYLAQYQDVADAGVDPVAHYIDHGADEGRDPGPRFSTRFYMDSYPDVADAGANPLLHFTRHGLAEGRLPRKLT